MAAVTGSQMGAAALMVNTHRSLDELAVAVASLSAAALHAGWLAAATVVTWMFAEAVSAEAPIALGARTTPTSTANPINRRTGWTLPPLGVVDTALRQGVPPGGGPRCARSE